MRGLAGKDYLGEVLELLGDEFEGLGVVGRQLDALPEMLGRVRALHSLHVQIADALVLADRGVPRVGQRAGTSDAKTRHIVRVLAERALIRHLGLKRAVPMVDDVPNHLVRLRHCCDVLVWERGMIVVAWG